MDNVEKDSCGFSLIKPLVVVAIVVPLNVIFGIQTNLIPRPPSSPGR